MTPRLKVSRLPVAHVTPPPALGQLMTDVEVARLLKLENPESPSTRKWIRQHVPQKKRIGHNTVRWFEADVLAWVASTGTDG